MKSAIEECEYVNMDYVIYAWGKIKNGELWGRSAFMEGSDLFIGDVGGEFYFLWELGILITP